MSRFFYSAPALTWFCRPATSICLGLSLAGCAFFTPLASHADEFSILPTGDPIAVQLSRLSSAPAPASLTRYEAALQTARAILEVQNREPQTVSRTQWRAIVALSGALKSELRQLGVDVEAARSLATKNLREGEVVTTPPTTANLPRESVSVAPTQRGPSFLTPGKPKTASTASAVLGSALALQLTPRLRVETALQAVPREATEQSTALAPLGAPLRASDFDSLSSQTALSYDLGRYLTLRAANSRLNWNQADESPLLGAPLFAGATTARGTGGGVDVNVGAGLKLSTEIERLRSDNGALANRIGGGASLSAWQDRLSLQMSLSRLLPQDKNADTTTAAEVGASLDVSRRLSLSLSYQGLFAPTPNSSASRVAGGLSLKF